MQGLSRGGDLVANRCRRRAAEKWNECVTQHDTIVSHVHSGSYPRLPCTVVELTSVLYEANKELGTLQVILASREQLPG